MTAAEEQALVAQLALAREHELPALIHTPHRDKLAGTARTLELVERAGLEPGHVLIDHNNELTIESVKATGAWIGFSIYPDTKVDEERMVRILQEHGPERILVNSGRRLGPQRSAQGAQDGRGDARGGFDEDDVDLVMWRNPVEFFGQSGRLLLDDFAEEPDRAATFSGNSLLRGERQEAEPMRFAHPGGAEVHLGYCSNVHAAEDVDGVIAQLARFAAPVREELGASRLGVGLWLTADGAAHLRRDEEALARLRSALAAGGLEVVTFNAFPYRAFHAPVVKAAVYEPN